MTEFLISLPSSFTPKLVFCIPSHSSFSPCALHHFSLSSTCLHSVPYKCHCTLHLEPLVLLPAIPCRQKLTSAFLTGITIALLYHNFLDLEKCISYLFPSSLPPLPSSFPEFSHFSYIVIPSSPLFITQFNVAENK